MIKIPSDFITTDELCSACNKKAEDIDIELVNAFIQKSSLMLVLDIKLNFTMPKTLETVLKKRVLSKIGNIKGVKINYLYDGIKMPEKAEVDNSELEGQFKWKKKKKDEPVSVNQAGETILLGRDFNDEPLSFAEVIESVGQKSQATTQGEVFKIESKTIKNDRELLRICIADNLHTFSVKAFVSKEKCAEIKENLSSGDVIHVKGSPEYDTFDNANSIMARSIKKVKKELKQDTYENGRRVELHIHSKMSDNDGFNEIEDIVSSAANWGQPAVAITDHGVVQAFPDAAKAADKMAKKGKNIKIIYGLEGYLYPDEDALLPDGTIDIKKNRTYHIILLAENQTGLKNLYKLVSISHIDYFYKKPRIPRSVLDSHREGIIVGSACEAGELYQAMINGASDEEMDRIASYYDYLEIQPLGNNRFMIREGIARDNEDLKNFNRRILACADRLGKLCCATTDSHYPTKDASIYRNIIMKGIGFKDTESDALYMRTTDEMIKEFDYLGDRAEEVVVTNTNKIADRIGDVMPVPNEKFPPSIEGADEKLRSSCYEKAWSIYGNPLPELIQERLDIELNSIISNGYAVMYIAAQMLVEKSNKDGYLVGSRGSVGSSFAATMAGITEVNPLAPHYICPECKYLEFTEELDKYDCGFDMPDKVCPHCGTPLNKDGLNIPFATFLGFNGDKEPDIDLNFAGEYQPIAHKYVGEIFGEKNVFKAGTVATIADKTAYGYVKHYLEDEGIAANSSDIEYLVKGCTGVKRTTGQHPGGIIVCPDDHEIYEFCPIQKPANKRDVDIITTHFDYHKIDKNLLKLDILGHDVPQLIRHLQLMTGVNPMTIPLGDRKTLSIFTSPEALGIKNPNYRFVHGTYAIPEFGTHFTRQMLDDIKPTTVSALIKMSGFSHGTQVWQGNAQNLIREKKATIDEVISSRDDIMNYLILKGLDNSDAFTIMETVRKNKVLSEEQLNLMKEHGVPDWYIWSCETLQYLFPRAHASAYVMMSIRMAWFKVNYPEAFYAAYFSSKVDNFDASVVKGGLDAIERKMDEFTAIGKDANAKQKEQLTVYEVMYEMYSRGFEFSKPELGISKARDFYVVEGKVNMPFMAISGIGETAAESLVDAYNEKAFFTIDDVRRRTKLSQTNIDELKKFDVFDGLPESAQISIFEL